MTKQGVLYCRNYTIGSAGQMAIPSIRIDNDLNVDIGSTYPITVRSTTENNILESTGGHELLVTRSPHDYKKQGSSLIPSHTFSPNLKIH